MERPKTHEISELSQWLQYWEDGAFQSNLVSRHPPLHHLLRHTDLSRPVRNWDGVRPHLLKAVTGDGFDQERFIDPDAFHLAEEEVGGRRASARLPYALWSWMRHSRRAYDLSGDLQLLLQTSKFHPDLDGMGIDFPFDAFVIRLEKPLVYSYEGVEHQYRCLLFHRIPAGVGGAEAPLFSICAPSMRTTNYRALKDVEKKQLVRACRSGDYVEAERLLHKSNARIRGISAMCMHMSEDDLKALNAKEEEFEGQGDGVKTLLEAFRIVIGLALYLKTLPAGSRYSVSSRLQAERGKPDPRAISSASELFAVTSKHLLTDEERAILSEACEASGREMSVHFRRGYWRRAPGKGQDPEAPKIVWVSPAIVRKDRLQENELPGLSVGSLI